MNCSRLVRFASIVLACYTTPQLGAQICQSTPSRGGLAFEHGKVNFGTTNGVTGAISGGHLALSGAYRHVEIGQAVSGNATEGRFAVVLGGSRVQVCPGFGAEYQTLAWTMGSDGTLNSRQLVGRAGLGIGIEQPVFGGVSVIPFALIQYAYTLVDYKLDATNAKVQEVGDTASAGDAEYGLLAHYKFVYGGFTARRALKNAPPYLARWVVGLSFSTGGPSHRELERPAGPPSTRSGSGASSLDRAQPGVVLRPTDAPVRKLDIVRIDRAPQ